MSEDFYLPRLVAQWNPTRGAWETGQQDLLSMRSELYLETWSTSGTTVDGLAYELPTPELRTDVSDSSLLPTAGVAGGGKQIPEDAVWSGKAVYKPDGTKVQVHLDRIEILLKTPTSQLGVNGGSQHPDKRKEGGHGPTLADEVEHLLPTPAANDSGNTPENHLRKKPGRDVVTSLMVLVDHGLIPTGGRIVPRSNDGNEPSAA